MKRQKPDYFLVFGWSRGDLSDDEQSQKASMLSTARLAPAGARSRVGLLERTLLNEERTVRTRVRVPKKLTSGRQQLVGAGARVPLKLVGWRLLFSKLSCALRASYSFRIDSFDLEECAVTRRSSNAIPWEHFLCCCGQKSWTEFPYSTYRPTR